jgi:DNA/RNA-binding domain of Phe-tRNA-synthetase-like protein
MFSSQPTPIRFSERAILDDETLLSLLNTADETGVTCRRWNWRQGRRTQLTEETHSIYFVLDRLAPYPIETLLAAGEELKGHLLRWFPSCSLTTDLLSEAHH